jgi:hypothetical protein
VVIDLDFNGMMSPSEVKSLLQQLSYSYSAAVSGQQQLHLHLLGATGARGQHPGCWYVSSAQACGGGMYVLMWQHLLRCFLLYKRAGFLRLWLHCLARSSTAGHVLSVHDKCLREGPSCCRQAITLLIEMCRFCAGDLEAALHKQLPGHVHWAATKSEMNFKEYFQVSCFCMSHSFMADVARP